VQILSAGVFLRGMGRKFPLRDRLLSYDSVQLAETRLNQGHERIHQVLGIFTLGTQMQLGFHRRTQGHQGQDALPIDLIAPARHTQSGLMGLGNGHKGMTRTRMQTCSVLDAHATFDSRA
jgi:hypothetical protein